MLKEQKERANLQKCLDNAKQTQSIEAARSALEKARTQFEGALTAANHPSPHDISEKLIAASNAQVDQDRLRKEIQEVNDRIAMLEGLRMRLEKVGADVGDKITREEIEQALELQEEIRKFVDEQPQSDSPKTTEAVLPVLTVNTEQQKLRTDVDSQKSQPFDTNQAVNRIKDAIRATNTLREQTKSKLGIEIKPGEEPDIVRQVVEGAKVAAAVAADKNSPGAMKAEIEKLRGQVQYFTNRGKFPGLDHPPCWADANGKIEYLFTVETRPEGFVANKAWPVNRDQDARSLPNIDKALSPGVMNTASFFVAMKPFLDWSKQQDPECRHFVYLTTTIDNADARDNARKLVEGFFYKLEVSR